MMKDIMNKKVIVRGDRYITIYTSEIGTTVSIYPISDDEEEK